MRPIGLLLFVGLCVRTLVFFAKLHSHGGGGNGEVALLMNVKNVMVMTGDYMIFVVLAFAVYGLILRHVDERIVQSDKAARAMEQEHGV